MENNPENRQSTMGQSGSKNIGSSTQERATASNAIQIPYISLPKGGGALKGIDEKFEVNAANGTAGFSVPIPISPGNNGFSLSLSLSYNYGGGNSPHELGWSVVYPSIHRKTDKRVPKYRDGLEEDVFMFYGVENLVPFLEETNNIPESLNSFLVEPYVNQRFNFTTLIADNYKFICVHARFHYGEATPHMVEKIIEVNTAVMIN